MSRSILISIYSILIMVCGVWWLCFRTDTSLQSYGKDTSQLLNVAAEFVTAHKDTLPQAKKLVQLKKKDDTTPAETYQTIILYTRALMAQGRQVDVFDLLSTLFAMEEVDVADKTQVGFILDMYVLLGAAADEAGMSNLSMEYYTRGLSLAEQAGLEPYLPRFNNNLGVCYFRLGDLDNAKRYFKEALKINQKLGLNYDIFLNYNNLAEIDLAHGKLDSALDNALKAMQHLNGADPKSLPAANMEGYIQGLIATIYIKKNELHIARSYVENAINQQRNDGLTSDLFESYMINSELFMQENQPDSALAYVNTALSLLNNEELKMRSDAFSRLSEIEEREGDMSLALNYLRKAHTLTDSLSNIEKIKRMEQCQQIYELDSKKRLEEQSNADLSGLAVWLIIGIVLLLILLIFTILAKRKGVLRLSECESKLQSVLHDASEKEETLSKEKEELEESLELAHRQLTSYAIQRVHTRRQTDDMVADIRKLLNETGIHAKELKEELKNVLSKISISKSGDDWTEFDYYFERVNTAFYRNLQTQHPDITEKQRRLCALLYLGLNTKEIAQVMCREVRSIESSRTRLRKKLGLSETENLNQYFQRFAAPADLPD